MMKSPKPAPDPAVAPLADVAAHARLARRRRGLGAPAVLLRPVRAQLRQLGSHENAHDDAQRGEAVCLRPVRLGFQ
jgi:hypothetical protein